MTEETEVKLMETCIINNEETITLVGIGKVALVGNNVLTKWMTKRKDNLVGARTPIEREK